MLTHRQARPVGLYPALRIPGMALFRRAWEALGLAVACVVLWLLVVTVGLPEDEL